MGGYSVGYKEGGGGGEIEVRKAGLDRGVKGRLLGNPCLICCPLTPMSC